MKFKGAIFDMDGTLVDSMGYWKIAVGRYVESKGKTPAADLGDIFLTKGLRATYPIMQADYGITEPVEEVSAGIYKIMDVAYNDVVIKPHVKDMLEAFKKAGIKMCVASATDSYLVRRVLKNNGIEDYFLDVFCCKDVGRGKQFPDIYDHALGFLGLDKSEALVFEDAVFAIRTLKANDYTAVGIRDKYALDDQEEIKALVDYYIEDYSNWNKIIK